MSMKENVFLFLDDDAFHPEGIRSPEKYYHLIGAEEVLELMGSFEVVKVVTVEDAIAHIDVHGCPDFISFDNDLKVKLEGIDLAKWLVEQDLEKPGFIPDNFNFFVHSQNIVAKERINSLLTQYLECRGETPKVSSSKAIRP